MDKNTNLDAVDMCLRRDHRRISDDANPGYSFWEPVISALRSESRELDRIEDRVLCGVKSYIEGSEARPAEHARRSGKRWLRYAMACAATLLCVFSVFFGYLFSDSGFLTRDSVATAPSDASGHTVFVGGETEPSASNVLPTLSVAVAQAEPGDTVVVSLGRIDEALRIDKPLRLVAHGG